MGSGDITATIEGNSAPSLSNEGGSEEVPSDPKIITESSNGGVMTTTSSSSVSKSTDAAVPSATETTVSTDKDNNNNGITVNSSSSPPSSLDIPTSEPSEAAVLGFLQSRGLSKAVIEFNNYLKRKKEEEDSTKKDGKKDKENKKSGPGGGNDPVLNETASSPSVNHADVSNGGQNNNNKKDTSESDVGVGVVETKKKAEKDKEMENEKEKEKDDESKNHEKDGIKEDGDEKEDEIDFKLHFNTSRHQMKFNFSSGGGLGYDSDALPYTGFHFRKDEESGSTTTVSEGGWSPRTFLHGFTSIQTWVLSLPNDEKTREEDAPQWIPPDYLRPFLEGSPLLAGSTPKGTTTTADDKVEHTDSSRRSTITSITTSPSVIPGLKAELLSVTFLLLVHSFCDLLEAGLPELARELWNTWKSLYVKRHPTDVRDLENLKTTAQALELRRSIGFHTEDSLKKLKDLRAAMDAETQQPSGRPSNKEESSDGGGGIGGSHSITRLKIQELETKLQKSKKVLEGFPYLSRVRGGSSGSSQKHLLRISSCTWRVLSERLASQMDSQNPPVMYALLQAHCHLVVEDREPHPSGAHPSILNDPSGTAGVDVPPIQWAAPIHPRSRAIEMGVTNEGEASSVPSSDDPYPNGRKLPFPFFFVPENDEDSLCSGTKTTQTTTTAATTAENDTNKKAKADAETLAKAVAFNRALRVHGFRRLEALEVARDFSARHQYHYQHHRKHRRKRRHPGGGIVDGDDTDDSQRPKHHLYADPLSPSVLMAALEDDGNIGVSCASLSPSDGRSVAVGCHDAAVRVYTALGGSRGKNGNYHHNMASTILIGHQKGGPVTDVSWNRDGRCLLSCSAGDGCLRLWDTLAVGPYGPLYDQTEHEDKDNGNDNNKDKDKIKKEEAKPDVEGTIAEPTGGGKSGQPPTHRRHGAALAVYSYDGGYDPSRYCGSVVGHSQQNQQHKVLWTCEFAPSGYYFASGGPGGGHIWTTDRPDRPVRILGKSGSVEALAWHPNCNYLSTGSGSGSGNGSAGVVRLWDVQTGACVRVLTGLRGPVEAVVHSHGGRHVAASDVYGTVATWDLDTGRLVHHVVAGNDTTTTTTTTMTATTRIEPGLGSSLSYSRCGTALVWAGGDALRVWDVRSSTARLTTYVPTDRTLLLDVQHTARNLLLCVGKDVSMMTTRRTTTTTTPYSLSAQQ